MVRWGVLLLGLCAAGCARRPVAADPCSPNPCAAPNKTRCANEDGTAVCLCNSGFVARPSGTCEAVSESNCPTHGGDPFEPDDCQARAQPISADATAHSQSIEPVGDYDFFAYNGGRHEVVEVTVTPQGTLAPRVDLFDEAGRQIAYAEDAGVAVLDAKLPATGTYAIRVMQSPIDPSVSTGTYALTLQSEGVDQDGDTPQDATAIFPDLEGGTPTTHSGRFELSADKDDFSFSPSPDQNYRLTFSGDAPYPKVALWTAASADLPAWRAQQPVIDFDVPAPGTATLELSLQEGQPLSSYAFTLTHRPK